MLKRITLLILIKQSTLALVKSENPPASRIGDYGIFF